MHSSISSIRVGIYNKQMSSPITPSYIVRSSNPYNADSQPISSNILLEKSLARPSFTGIDRLFNVQKRILSALTNIPIKLCKYDDHKVRAVRKEVIANARKFPSTHLLNSPERLELRANILKELFLEQKDINKTRDFYLVIGIPGAGKSTFGEIMAKDKNAFYINLDEIKLKIPEYKNDLKLEYVVNREAVNLKSELLDKAMAKDYSIVLEDVSIYKKELLGLIRKAKNSNYNVHIRMIDVPTEVAVQRTLSRYDETKRFVDPLFHRFFGKKPFENYKKVIKTESGISSYALYSNDVPRGKAPELIRKYSTFGENEFVNVKK